MIDRTAFLEQAAEELAKLNDILRVENQQLTERVRVLTGALERVERYAAANISGAAEEVARAALAGTEAPRPPQEQTEQVLDAMERTYHAEVTRQRQEERRHPLDPGLLFGTEVTR